MLNEKKLSKAELAKREDIIMKMKKNKSALVKKYGKDAEKVMYGRATNIAKKQAESMENTRLREMIKSALMGPGMSPEAGEDRYKGEQDLATASHALDQLEAKLKAHDWWYMMSDDHRVYKNGSYEQDEIRSIMKDLEGLGYGKDAKDLFNQYAPDRLKMDEAKGKDMDKDGDIDSDDYMAARDAAIKKAKGEEVDEHFLAIQNVMSAASDKKKDKKDVKEGTWALGNAKDIQRIVDVLNQLKDNAYNVVGDDLFFDDLDSAISRAEELMMNAPLSEDIDLGHQDNEPHMIKAELYRIGKYAMELYAMAEEAEEMGGEVDFPAWWQAKITTAMNNMVSAKHYLDFEIKEPKIDAVVDALTGEEEHEGEPVVSAAPRKSLQDYIDEGIVDEGLLDRLKANLQGVKSSVGTKLGNFSAYLKGDKEAIADPKLAKNMAMLKQKAVTLDKEIWDVVTDLSKMFPADVLQNTPEQFQTVLANYANMLSKTADLNKQIASGNIKAPAGSSGTKTSGTKATDTKATDTKATDAKAKTAQPRDEKGRFVSTKAKPNPSEKPDVKAKPISDKYEVTDEVYSYKDKNYSVQVDKKTKEKFFQHEDGRIMDIAAIEKNFKPKK